MKIMDINGQDECLIEAITPAKKKKMIQAQLPFQTLSPLDSPKGLQHKKRKLTSPSVDSGKSPKLVKVSERGRRNKSVDAKHSDSDAKNERSECIEVIDDVDTENIKENNKAETLNTSTPRRASTGQKKLDKDKIKSSPLTKFLKKTDKEVDSSKENHQNSLGEDKDKSVHKDSQSKTESVNKESESKTESVNKESESTTESINKESESKTESVNKESESTTESVNKESNINTKSVSKDSDTKAKKKRQNSESHVNSEAEDVPAIADSSLCQNSDSDVLMLSSDNEDKDEHVNSNDSEERDGKLASPVTIKTPNMDKIKQKKLTPKQQEKKLLSAKKKEEREKRRLEKEKKLEEEREIRRREKEEKRREKEEKRREREEKEKVEKEQKMMEKKMKELKKQMEIEQKQKEKQAKEEERKKREEAKEEEKKKKEEEKLEAERKKQKAASNFTSFFVAKKQEKSVDEEASVEVKNFMPFEVKADMKMAPVCRRILNEQEKLSLDDKCSRGNARKSNLYLSEIKDKIVVPRKSTKTWPLETKEDVVILDEENDGSSNIVNQNIIIEKQRTKLLQFSENRRPPYRGTWRKRSKSINPRNPFSKDTKWFNYEVDSDDEWEEEEPGESLHGSDEEKDEENPDDNEYDVDNEFMVPHGYLSDEELRADGEDKEDTTPETQKFKLQVLGEQFETERNTKTAKLKPKIIGCIWRGADNKFSENVPRRTVDFLSAREAWVRQIPVTLPTATEHESTTECSTPTQQTAGPKRTRLPEEALPDLIRLVHGNTHGRDFLVKEFKAYWIKRNKVGENQISKASILHKIREFGKWMACPEEGPMHLKACWYVPEETRKDFNLEDLTLPNRWSYNLERKRKSDFTEVLDKSEREDKEKKEEKKSVPLITQFTKKITQEEMKKQLTVKPSGSPASSPSSRSQAKTHKRAALISVGRGEQFSKTSKENLLKSFVVKGESKDNKKDDDDEVTVVSEIKRDQADVQVNHKDKTEERLGEVPMECEREPKGKEKSSRNKGKTLNSPSTNLKVRKKKNVKDTVDTPMDVDNPEED